MPSPRPCHCPTGRASARRGRRGTAAVRLQPRWRELDLHRPHLRRLDPLRRSIGAGYAQLHRAFVGNGLVRTCRATGSPPTSTSSTIASATIASIRVADAPKETGRHLRYLPVSLCRLRTSAGGCRCPRPKGSRSILQSEGLELGGVWTCRSARSPSRSSQAGRSCRP